MESIYDNISNIIGVISKRGVFMVSNAKNKDKIVAAAIDLFRRKGYSTVMVKDITEQIFNATVANW